MFKVLALLFSIAHAQEAPACQPPDGLFAAVAKMHLTMEKLGAPETAAFNKSIVSLTGNDPSSIPEMDFLVIVHQADPESPDILFAFNKGCYIGAAEIPDALVRRALSSV